MPTESHSESLHDLLREEIAEHGPLPFARFMELALYHPTLGYYTRGAKPIGKSGDFYTASQLQPVFGILMRQYFERLCEEHSLRPPRRMVEFGAGRGEMESAFTEWAYRSVEIHETLSEDIQSGFVFANELFDALPVDVGIRHGNGIYEKRVGRNEQGFAWSISAQPSAALEDYANRYAVPSGDGFQFESHERSLGFLRALLAKSCDRLAVFVDYGYTARDWKRFPSGTLMSYRMHLAVDDVLKSVGTQDITSHVPFHALVSVAEASGALVLRMERLSSALLYAGEKDEFESVLHTDSDHESFTCRQQLKTLLYSFGESFNVLALWKGASS